MDLSDGGYHPPPPALHLFSWEGSIHSLNEDQSPSAFDEDAPTGNAGETGNETPFHVIVGGDLAGQARRGDTFGCVPRWYDPLEGLHVHIPRRNVSLSHQSYTFSDLM